MFVKNDVTELKIVVGASIPLPAGAKGRKGCSVRTAKPNTNMTVLNSSSESVYCFQPCGPVSTRLSIHRSQPNARNRPSAIRARYNPQGIDNTTEVMTMRAGNVHMELT